MKTFNFFGYIILISLMLPVTMIRAGDTPQLSKIAAKVNGREILVSDVNFFVDRVLEGAKAMGQQITPELEKTIRGEWLDRMISRELLLQQAMAEEVSVSDAEIEKGLISAHQQGVNISSNKLREVIKADLMINKVIETHILAKIVVTDKDIKEFYNTRKEEFRESEQVRARHILLRVNPSDPQEKRDRVRERMEDILAKARSGKKDFGELAERYSEAPSAPKQGDIGYFGRGEMVPAFESAAFALKPGEISGVVETRFGYHIIKVEDRKESRLIPFDEVKEDIRVNLSRSRSNKEIDAWITKLRDKATIEIVK